MSKKFEPTDPKTRNLITDNEAQQIGDAKASIALAEQGVVGNVHNAQGGTERKFRNYVVCNNHKFFRHNPVLNLERLHQQIDTQKKWYDIRHRAQPHEVNDSMYIVDVDLNNRLFEISCQDICSEKFLPWFSNFMQQTQVSTSYNHKHVHDIHDVYVQAQIGRAHV